MTKVANRAEGRRAAMRAAGLLFGAIFGALMVSGPAVACTVGKNPFYVNRPLVTNPDCSFKNADSGPRPYIRDVVSGNRALDRGNGRVAQKLVSGGACGSSEILVFTECETGKSIEIIGIDAVDPSGNPFPFRSIKLIQPPHGPIRADSDDTVESLAAEAEKAGYDYLMRGAENDEYGYWTRYKSNCGCKLFYPDSKAASARWARTGK